jgi:hypothetical protein
MRRLVKMTSMFRDERVNRRFLADGYVVVPFLDAPAVAQLLRDFEHLRPAELEPLHRAAGALGGATMTLT